MKRERFAGTAFLLPAFWAAMLLAGAMFLTGCGKTEPENAAAVSQAAAEAGSGMEADDRESSEGGEEDYGTVTIQNGGRTLTFTQMPQKVFCCHLYAAENMVMLGLEDYIVGEKCPGQ